MSDKTTLPNDEQDLSMLYQETIDHHHSYLDRLQTAFNKRCENIGVKTKEKLKDVPEEKKEEREKIMTEEQEMLDKTLAELKYAINRSNSNARKRLEDIQTKLDSDEVNLEKELSEI